MNLAGIRVCCEKTIRLLRTPFLQTLQLQCRISFGVPSQLNGQVSHHRFRPIPNPMSSRLPIWNQLACVRSIATRSFAKNRPSPPSCHPTTRFIKCQPSQTNRSWYHWIPRPRIKPVQFSSLAPHRPIRGTTLINVRLQQHHRLAKAATKQTAGNPRGRLTRPRSRHSVDHLLACLFGIGERITVVGRKVLAVWAATGMSVRPAKLRHLFIARSII